jgi:DNA invertase Pin-like site-specific DNA recombinase
MDIGYARVSTRELTAADRTKVFREKASGDRAELARVLRRLEPGDVLVVIKRDHLARSMR